MKDDLIYEVIEILKEAGFIVSERSNAKSFDVAARRDDLILLVKVLYNIDSLNEEVARSMNKLAVCLKASPIIVGQRKSDGFLEDSVVYYRYGIPVVNVVTLYNYFVKNEYSYVYSAPGGLYVNIDEEAMREARMRKNLSLGDIAIELGVSRRSVQKYEEGEMSATIDIALKLEDILEVSLIEPLDILKRDFEELPSDRIEVYEPYSSFERHVLMMIRSIGFDVFTTAHAPFSAISQLEREKIKILTGIDRYTKRMIKRAKIVSSLSEVMRTKSVFVVNGNVKYKQIDNTVLMEKEELRHIKDVDEFTAVMEEKMKSK
ncbi:MAG: transcriptional regulator [Candidatus Methanospirareceae archaeon]